MIRLREMPLLAVLVRLWLLIVATGYRPSGRPVVRRGVTTEQMSEGSVEGGDADSEERRVHPLPLSTLMNEQGESSLLFEI